MNKCEKYIYIVIALVMVAVIASGTTYIIMKNNNPEIKEPEDINNNDKEQENTPSEETENLILTDNDLKDYLSYVPYSIDNEGNAYTYEKIVINNIKQYYTLGTALNYLYNECQQNKISCFYNETMKMNEYVILEGYEALKQEDALNMLKKMYNISNITINDNNNDYVAEAKCIGYYYKDDKYIAIPVCGDLGKLSHIINYEIINNDLYIYEVVASFDGLRPNLQDYYTNKEVKLTYDINDANWENEVINYFENHLNDFTQYKHTFKKNNKGYYWYSTEVVK